MVGFVAFELTGERALPVKEVQEWALHWARLFDGITALEAIDRVRRWLTGR